MYSPEFRQSAVALLATGTSLNRASAELGVARSTLRSWRERPRPDPAAGPRPCVRCLDEPELPPAGPYAYLLGQYLGDGCISRAARDVFVLRIACSDDYPGVVADCERAIRAVRPGAVSRVRSQGCSYVTGYWKHWPCLFPQHGPGRKHSRTIELADWQREVVERHPGQFVRGLLHSDGCRVENWTQRVVAGEVKRYTYPRYFFTNTSPDIMALCEWALGLLGVGWTRPSRKNLSVARRADTAVLDLHVGPKS